MHLQTGGEVIFLLLLAIAGLIASWIGTWIFVALVAFVTMPVYLAAAIWNNHSIGSTIAYVIGGVVIFQISYGFGLLLQATLRPGGRIPPRSSSATGKTRQTHRVFGVWLPLIALYDTPCQADGSPWDGQHDPNFRVTILVFGLFGRAISMTVGHPWKVAPGTVADEPYLFGHSPTVPAPNGQPPRSSRGQSTEK